MNILLWPTNYYPYIGGLERLVHNLALDLKSKGHSVMVVTDATQKSQISQDEIQGVPVLKLPLTTAIVTKNLLLIKQVLERLDQLFSDFQPDVVNVHGWYETMAFFQVRAAAKSSATFCLTIHGLLEQPHYSTLSCQRLWARCQSVNTVSKALNTSLQKYGFAHPDLRLIHNASQESKQPLVEPDLPVKNLLCIGRLSTEKRFDLALEALHRLRPRYSDLHLTIVGGGQLYPALAQLRDKLDLQANVTLVDYVPPDHVDQFIDQSSVVLVPSDYEAFGLVALEAAWRGRAVIASRVMGLCEVVAHNETGLLVSPGSAEALADAIESLIKAPALVQQMAKAAYVRANMHFHLPGMGARYERMYQGQPASVHE